MSGRVDGHAHAFVKNLPLVDGARWKPACDHPVEDYVNALDASGVDYGVLVAHSAFGTYADYTLEALEKYPRLRGTCILAPDTAPERLAVLDTGGMVGARIMALGYDLPDIAAPEYQRLLRRLADLNWHVHLYAEGKKVADALPLLLRSGVNVIIDHFGHPELGASGRSAGTEAAVRAVETGRAWIKLSAAFRFAEVDTPALATRLLSQVGPERLIWGSDWPFTRFENTVRYADTVAAFEHWVPRPADRDRIHQTARKIYRFAD